MMPGVVYNKDRVMGKECDCGKRVAPLTTQSSRVVRIPDFIPGEENRL